MRPAWRVSARGRRETKAIPEILSAGCDVILFSHDPEADVAAIKAALKDGSLDQERVDEATLRVLAFKAALGLHRPTAPRDRSLARGSAANRQAAKRSPHARRRW